MQECGETTIRRSSDINPDMCFQFKKKFEEISFQNSGPKNMKSAPLKPPKSVFSRQNLNFSSSTKILILLLGRTASNGPADRNKKRQNVINSKRQTNWMWSKKKIENISGASRYAKGKNLQIRRLSSKSALNCSST